MNEPTEPKKPLWKTVLDIFIYLAIVAAVVFGLPKLLVSVLNTDYPMAAITSGSMWPALKRGDLVFIKAVPASEIRVGDVIVYRNYVNNTLTIHRVTAISSTTVTTKGDANFNPDAPAALPNIIGRSVTLFGRPVRIPLLGFITQLVGGFRSTPTIQQ